MLGATAKIANAQLRAVVEDNLTSEQAEDLVLFAYDNVSHVDVVGAVDLGREDEVEAPLVVGQCQGAR